MSGYRGNLPKPCTSCENCVGAFFAMTNLVVHLKKSQSLRFSFRWSGTESRGVTRLDGARGKKQVWRLHVRIWGLSEANVLYWRKYLWHCWDFSAPPTVIWLPGNLAPLVTHLTASHSYLRKSVVVKPNNWPETGSVTGFAATLLIKLLLPRYFVADGPSDQVHEAKLAKSSF